ncbi:MAG: cyclic nucleotide-binding domain-containing protein [Candidatus Hydrogenedentes bacterium]|nr:cyclic nucleotide-binding domain-containing protein [Candidatus Hydrogenedentota bacterium]
MNLQRVRSCIRETPVFKGLTPRMIDRVGMTLLWTGEIIRFSPGQPLFVEGDERDTSGCILLDGDVTITREGGDPVTCTAPELFGEMHQLEETAQRTATVWAATDAVVLRFDWHEFITAMGLLLTQSEQIQLKEAFLHLTQRRRKGQE